MRWFLIGTAAVIAAFLWFRHTSVNSLSPTDPRVLLLGGVAFFLLCLSLVIPWRPWTPRRVGLFWLMLGVAIFWVGLWAVSEFWDIRETTEQTILDVFLATQLVGSVLAIVGVLVHFGNLARRRRQRRKGGSDD